MNEILASNNILVLCISNEYSIYSDIVDIVIEQVKYNIDAETGNEEWKYSTALFVIFLQPNN